jgi:hypothetical protein
MVQKGDYYDNNKPLKHDTKCIICTLTQKVEAPVTAARSVQAAWGSGGCPHWLATKQSLGGVMGMGS